MKKEREVEEPNIIEILNAELRKSYNDLAYLQSVESIAQRMDIDSLTIKLWLEQDKLFQDGLKAVKTAFDNDPWKDTEFDEIKFDEFTLAFGISVVLEETKKRYTV